MVHVFLKNKLIPPVAVKLGSTGYRFARYYTGAPRYVEKGPPYLPLRVLAPVLVCATLLVFGSGVALLVIGHRSDFMLELHKVAFIVWGVCFAAHFLWYLPHVWRVLSTTWRDTSGRATPGGWLRGLLLSASLGGGLALALALLSLIESWHGRHGA